MPHFLALTLSCIVGIVSLVCWILILIQAFQDAIWKGLVGFLCGLYLLYYAVAEYDSDHKWEVVILAFGGAAIAAGLQRMG